MLLPDSKGEQSTGTAPLREQTNIQSLEFQGKIVNLTASFGVTALGERARSLETLLQRSDVTIYAAKRAGRDRVAWSEA